MSGAEVGALLGEMSMVRKDAEKNSKEMRAERAEMDRRLDVIDDNMERFGAAFVDFAADHKQHLAVLDTGQRKLASAQKIDDEERADRVTARRIWVFVAKIAATVMTIAVLPAVGWGTKLIVDDYTAQRAENAAQHHDVLLLKTHDVRADEDAHALSDRVESHEQRIHEINGRLQGIETGQQSILEAIQDNGRRRR